MIGTIGLLVQDASRRWRWVLATGLYAFSCVTTAALLGAFLGAVGQLAGHALRGALVPWMGAAVVGILAVGYALSDLGMIALPRPTLRRAVPVTWWRRWRPYGAAVAYGAALGIGVSTHIFFGSFYVLCTWCLLQGNAVYGAALMGTYGAARALVLLPASWLVYCRPPAPEAWMSSRLFDLRRAQIAVAGLLLVFGAQSCLSLLLR